jgi:hypothetical protein
MAELMSFEEMVEARVINEKCLRRKDWGKRKMEAGYQFGTEGIGLINVIGFKLTRTVK